MHAFSIVTLGIFVAGYTTARWDLVTRVHELAIFAWDRGVVARTAKGFAGLTVGFLLLILPFALLAVRETKRHPRPVGGDAMVTQDGLLRVFWPSGSVSEDVSGVIVGWRNSEHDITVVSILQDVDVRSIENALRIGTLFRNCRHPIRNLFQGCGELPLQVVGIINPQEIPLNFDQRNIVVHTKALAAFPSIYCSQDDSFNIQVLVYRRPNPRQMQFLSLEPISLAIGDKSGYTGFDDPAFLHVEAAEKAERERKARLVEKLKLHTVKSYKSTDKELSLPTILNQLNCSSETDAILQKNLTLVRKRRQRQLSVGERVVESANNLWDHTQNSLWSASKRYIRPVAKQVFFFCLIALRVLAEALLRIIEWRPRPQDPALKDVSSTAQQVDLRLQQFCYWPIQYMTLRERKDDWESVTTSHPEYIRFYNSIWLVANDMILGIAIGSFIIENAVFVGLQSNEFISKWSLDGLRRLILWLMSYPGGLKLNNELAIFMGDLFIWVIDYWASCMWILQLYLPALIRVIGVASFAGATMPLSLVEDLLSVLTLHIHCFYIASARLYSAQLSIIISLFHLFRGKKRNVLRNRIDSCDYELDQLLLGTILFTLLTFLLPTVAVFYFTFASARMGIIFLKAGLDILLACLNHFPLFALMLRVKDSRRLPGGVRFSLQENPSTPSLSGARSGNTGQTSHIILKSVPLPMRAIFHEYRQLGDRIRKHYLSPSVFLYLATGGFIPPLHRKNLYGLQYSMLPAQRTNITTLWARLTGTRDRTRYSTANGSATGETTSNGIARKKQ